MTIVSDESGEVALTGRGDMEGMHRAAIVYSGVSKVGPFWH